MSNHHYRDKAKLFAVIKSCENTTQLQVAKRMANNFARKYHYSFFAEETLYNQIIKKHRDLCYRQGLEKKKN